MLAFAPVVLLAFASPARAAQPSLAEMDAAARSAGNRPETAKTIALALFTTIWPAQILKVRVDGIGSHQVAGLMLSGAKFHAKLDRAGFEREIVELLRRAFAAAPIEEVDVWATVPIPYDKREPVSGDYAQPTSRIVFALSCRRDELAGLPERLTRGRDVYWAADFLSTQGRP